MDGFFTPVSQTYLRTHADPPELKDSTQTKDYDASKAPTATRIASASDALDVLKNEPDYDLLVSVLKYLDKSGSAQDLTPTSAQIVQVIVSEIIPNYYASLSQDGDPHALQLLLRCLGSVAGINAVVARLKALIQDAKAGGEIKRPDIKLNLSTLLELAAALLDRDDTLVSVWNASKGRVEKAVGVKALSQEFLALFAGGRILSTAAEAVVIAQKDRKADGRPWLTDGLLFSNWIGRNVVTWMTIDAKCEELKLCCDLFVRALRLGYSERLIRQLIEEQLISGDDRMHVFMRLFDHISPLEQKRIFYAVLKFLAESHLNQLGTNTSPEANTVVSAAAGLIRKLIGGGGETRRNMLVTWLTSSTGAGLGDGIGIRRAVLAAVGEDSECVTLVFEKSLSQFGDQLYIRHSPILQQEAHAQVLLLSAGYVYRRSHLRFKMLVRSSIYLQAISNRLSAPHTKARLLGMVIGEALSMLSDSGETKLNFGTDEMDPEEANWYKSLTQVADQIGPIGPLVKPATVPEGPKPVRKATAAKPPSRAPQTARTRPSPGFVIEEIEESEESEDDDLVTYAKPSSDPEDSDDDPTAVRRDKPKAPVYIRNLISYLRDSENYDKQKLALSTAPSLIRRKAHHGTEVSAHAEELASLLVGLQDKFEMDGFSELRQQGMLALVVGQPKDMAPWFAKTFYEGDYSISQRASILVALGLGARELAGFEESEYTSTDSFPSKRLPDRLERLYLESSDAPGNHKSLPSSGSKTNLKALPANALDTIAGDLTSSFLAPLAAHAADATTGPDVLKLSSFTSRLDAQGPSKGKSIQKSRAKGARSIPNTTASIISSSFFYPLTARFQHALRSPASQRRSAVAFNPYLLALFLKTLALLVHAAGPSTLSLPQMTAELWDMLLGVRGLVAGDVSGMHAVLMALAALLEVNDGSADGMRRLCQEMPREVVEMQEWVGTVFHGIRGDDGGEESKVKVLAAGILVALQEAMEKYRAFLVGDTIGFT